MFLRERSALNECWSQNWKALLSILLGKEEVVEALVTTDWETEVMSNIVAENISRTSKNPPPVIAALFALLHFTRAVKVTLGNF